MTFSWHLTFMTVKVVFSEETFENQESWQAHYFLFKFFLVIIFIALYFRSCHLCICPSISAYTEATMLFSRQSTLDDLDDMPQNIPKTSERARPKLRKMYGLDMSNSSADSGSSVMSRCWTHHHHIFITFILTLHTPIRLWVFFLCFDFSIT